MTKEKPLPWKYGFLKGIIGNIESYCKTFAPDRAVENILQDIERAKEEGVLEHE